MKYEIKEDRILIYGKDDFCAEHILSCGQIFSYFKKENRYVVLSSDKKATIEETDNGYTILTKNPQYFENFFDLKTDYSKIKTNLSSFELLKVPISYGQGIRILKQDLFETLISFIVSANNNITRIKAILFRLREKFGTKIDDFYALPTREQLLSVKESDFCEIGAGYRAKYLYQVVRMIDDLTLLQWNDLSTDKLKEKLLSLMGVGEKVADCILLFGYSRMDVFPVDTWIEKVYQKYFDFEKNRSKIRQNLIKKFGNLSGYAQQYLFYAEREGVEFV